MTSLGTAAPELYYGDYFGEDKWARRRFELTSNLLEPYIKKGIKVLDIGCYKGDMLTVLGSDVEYVGVDFDKPALKIAEKKGAKRTYYVNVEQEKLPFREKFDIILMTELLEHLKDPKFVISQAAKLLKSNGVVVVSLPNECNIFQRIKVLLGYGIDSTGFDPYYHLHYPTVKQSEEFVASYFEIIDRKYSTSAEFGGKLSFLSKITPIWLLELLSWISPGLFSRGVIFLARGK